MHDVLGINFACDHVQLGGVGVVESHKHKGWPVPLLISVGEILEMESICWVVYDIPNVIFVCSVLKKDKNGVQ